MKDIDASLREGSPKARNDCAHKYERVHTERTPGFPVPWSLWRCKSCGEVEGGDG